MNTRAEVLLWAKRIVAKRASEPHALLELSADATLEQAQAAFHAIARAAHPDLHRTTSTPDELEAITSAFAVIASAYQQFRAQRLTTTRMAAIPASMAPAPRTKTSDRLPGVASVDKPAGAVLVPDKVSTTGVTQQMNSRAAVHYRKGSMSLQRGDLAAGVLHLKMAIAADPQSKFLRQALAQVEVELAKKG